MKASVTAVLHNITPGGVVLTALALLVQTDLLHAMDPQPQIVIEAKIVEVEDNFTRDLGSELNLPPAAPPGNSNTTKTLVLPQLLEVSGDLNPGDFNSDVFLTYSSGDLAGQSVNPSETPVDLFLFNENGGVINVNPQGSLGVRLNDGADPAAFNQLLGESGSDLLGLVPVPPDAGGGYLASVTQPADPSAAQALESTLIGSGSVEYIEIEICRKFLPGEPFQSAAGNLSMLVGAESIASMVGGAIDQFSGVIKSLSGPLPQDTHVLVGPSAPSVEGFVAGGSLPWDASPPNLSTPQLDGTSTAEFSSGTGQGGQEFHSTTRESAGQEFHSTTREAGQEFHSVTRDEMRIGIECYTVYIPVTNPGGTAPPETPIEYDTTGGACSAIDMTKQPDPAPKVNVVSGQPDGHFQYPRPIPLQAMIRDYDSLSFACDGCGGGQASTLMYIRDNIIQGSYQWTLTNKGSLNKPFVDQDDLTDQINALKAKIAAAQASIDALQKKKDDLDASRDARKAAIDAEITALEADKAKAQQEVTRLEQEIADLQARIEEKQTEITEAKTEIDNLDQQVADKQEKIKELQKKIDGEPTGEEAEIAARLKKLQADIEAKQAEIAQLEAQQASQEQALRQAYNQALQNLATARQQLNAARKQVTAKQQEITALEKRLYASRSMRDFINQRSQILSKSEKLKNQYFANASMAPAPASELLSTAQQLIRSPSTQQQGLLDQFTRNKDSLLSQMQSQCAGLSGMQVTSCNADVADFKRELDSLSKSLNETISQPMVDPEVWKKLQQARTELAQLGQAASNAEQGVKAAEKTVVQAQQTYLDGLAQMDQEAQQKADELQQLRDDETRTALELKGAQVNAAIEREQNTPQWLEDIANLRMELEDLYGDIAEQRATMEAAGKELDRLTTELAGKEAEKAGFETQIQIIDGAIAAKQAEKAAIDNESDQIQQEIDAIGRDKTKWEEELRALEEQARQLALARQGNKTAKGQLVYYIPPPLEDVMKDKARFEELKKDEADKKAEYEQAIADKAKFQKQAFDIIKGMNEQLWVLKNATERAEELDTEIKSLNDDKGAKETRYNADNQQKLGDAQAEKQRAQQEKTNKDTEVEEAKRKEQEEQQQVDQAKEKVDQAKDDEKAKEDDVFTKINAYNLDKQKRQRKGELLAEKRATHAQTLSNLRGKESELQRISDRLSRALSAEDEGTASGLRSQMEAVAAELRQLNQQVQQETVQLEADANDFKLATVAEKGSKQAEEDAQQALFDAQRALREARQKLREETEDLDAAKEKRLAEERRQRESEEQLKQAEAKFDEAQKDLDAGTTKLVEDEDKKIKDAETEKTEAENKKTEATNKLNDLVADRNKWKADEATAKQKVKDSWDAWKKAEQDLKDFLTKEMEQLSFTATINLDADDEAMPDYRSKDDHIKRVIQISYKNRKPTVKGPTEDLKPPTGGATSAICNPVVRFTPTASIEVKPDPSQTPTQEPQTIALYYKKGAPLYDLWPPRKDTAKKLQRAAWEWLTAAGDVDMYSAQCVPGGGGGDAIAIGNEFDSSTNVEGLESEYGDQPQACAPGPPPFGDAIDDITEYRWKIPLYSSGAEKFEYIDTPKIPDNKCKDKRDFEVDYFDAKLQGPPDLEKHRKSDKFEITAGIKGDAPEEANDFGYGNKVELRFQVFDGAHHGLPGETVIWTVTKFVPEDDSGGEKKYGFGADKKQRLEEKTDSSGYSKVDFYLDDKYGEATVTAKWMRDEECETAEIKISKLLSLQKIKVGFAPKEGWKEAADLFQASGAGDFEGIAKKLPDGPEGGVIFATGLLDNISDPVDGKKILYSVKEPGGVSMDPEEDETRIYGLSWSFAGETPEEAELKMLAKVEEKLKDVTKPSEVDGEQSTTTTNRFLIGREGAYLTIETDEPFVPGGDPISGTGKLIISGNPGMGIPVELATLSLDIEGVELRDDGSDPPIAKAGAVTWDSAKAGVKPFTKAGFTLSLSKLGLSAGADGIIEGKAKLPGEGQEEIDFSAIIGPDGFIGTLSNFPEIKLGGMTLKKGASAVIDFHDSENPKPAVKNWPAGKNGFVIRQGELQLPDAFKGRAEKPPVITFKDVYVDTTGLNGEIGVDYTIAANIGNMKFAIESFKLELAQNKPTSGTIKGGVTFPDPFIGEVQAEVAIGADDSYKVTIKTDKVVNAPSLGLAFKLIEATGEYKEQLFSFELSAALSSENFGNGDGDITIRRFKFNSNGDFEAENIEINQDVEFGKGFKITLNTFSFKKTDTEFKLGLDTGFQFGTILTADKVAVAIGTGPVIEEFELDINVDRKPVTIKAKIKYKADLFSGEVDVDVEKMFGIKGIFILGAMKGDDPYQYWYVELNSDVAIPLGQSGLNLLEIGGGVGYNYDPPIGSAEGAPRHTDSFSLKASVAIGNVPKGEIFKGRVALVLVTDRFSINGKIWLLTKEESLYGEGQLNLYWQPSTRLDGFVRMVVALPGADGQLMSFTGQVDFRFAGSSDWAIKSRTLEGSVLQRILGEGTIDVKPGEALMEGNIRYDLAKEVPLSIVTLKVEVHLRADGRLAFKITESTTTLDASLSFRGDWDVNLETRVKDFDIVSGNISALLKLHAVNRSISVEGKLRVSWDTWVNSGSTQVDIGYSN